MVFKKLKYKIEEMYLILTRKYGNKKVKNYCLNKNKQFILYEVILLEFIT